MGGRLPPPLRKRPPLTHLNAAQRVRQGPLERAEGRGDVLAPPSGSFFFRPFLAIGGLPIRSNLGPFFFRAL